MADHSKMREDLEDLLVQCSPTEAGRISRATGTKILAGSRLPKRLEEFLDSADPEAASFVMSDNIQDFGARVFRQILIAAMNRRVCESDLAQNRHDVAIASDLLVGLAMECSNTWMLPPAAAELLGRVGGALRDIRDSNVRPALFDCADGGTATVGRACEGRLAAALEIVIRGGMKLAAAKDWLKAEMRKAGLVDEAGSPISVERVDQWRDNFRKRKGAANGQEWFNSDIEDSKPLIHAPRDDRKLAACQDRAGGLVGTLVRFNRTVAAPHNRVTHLKQKHQ
jgi:hypothetical protein